MVLLKAHATGWLWCKLCQQWTDILSTENPVSLSCPTYSSDSVGESVCDLPCAWVVAGVGAEGMLLLPGGEPRQLITKIPQQNKSFLGKSHFSKSVTLSTCFHICKEFMTVNLDTWLKTRVLYPQCKNLGILFSLQGMINTTEDYVYSHAKKSTCTNIKNWGNGNFLIQQRLYQRPPLWHIQ